MKKSAVAPLPRRAPSARLRAAVTARSAAARPRRGDRMSAVEPKERVVKPLIKSRVKSAERRDSTSSVYSDDSSKYRPNMKQTRVDALRSGRSEYSKPRLDLKTRVEPCIKSIDESAVKMPMETYETFDFASASTTDALYCTLDVNQLHHTNVAMEHMQSMHSSMQAMLPMEAMQPMQPIQTMQTMADMQSLQTMPQNIPSLPPVNVEGETETRSSSTEAQRRIPADVLKKLGRSGGRRRIKYLNYKNRSNGAAPFGCHNNEGGDAGNINFVRLRTGTSIARCNSLRGTSKAPAKSLAACHQGVYRMLQPVL